jgi:hypothetical protein
VAQVAYSIKPPSRLDRQASKPSRLAFRLKSLQVILSMIVIGVTFYWIFATPSPPTPPAGSAAMAVKTKDLYHASLRYRSYRYYRPIVERRAPQAGCLLLLAGNRAGAEPQESLPHAVDRPSSAPQVNGARAVARQAEVSPHQIAVEPLSGDLLGRESTRYK